MTGRVVTISATYGSGGTRIAPAIAARLGFAFADRLMPYGQPEPKLDPTAAGGVADGLALLSATWNIPVPRGADPADRLRGHVEAGIRALVDSGDVVILGRAAAVVLAGAPRAFHVRLDGPVEARARRAAELGGIDVRDARKRLPESDETRHRFVERLYGRDAADPTLYHLVLDSTAFTIDAAVDLVVAAAQTFFGSVGA